MRLRDLTGLRFGRLIVVARAPSSPTTTRRRTMWLCVCDCGNEASVDGDKLKRADTKQPTRSCGCYGRERSADSGHASRGRKIAPGRLARMVATRTRHGHRTGGRPTATYATWASMVARCTSEAHASFPEYGGRGIGVCERWLASFENFLADMGERPPGRMTLDRVDGAKGYSPDNCRWATYRQQNRNLRTNRVLSHKGRSMCVSEWAEEVGLHVKCLRGRIDAGWPVWAALTLPRGSKRPALNSNSTTAKAA